MGLVVIQRALPASDLKRCKNRAGLTPFQNGEVEARLVQESRGGVEGADRSDVADAKTSG